MKKLDFISGGIISFLAATVFCCSCGKEEDRMPERRTSAVVDASLSVTPESVAALLADVPFGEEQMREVYDAVSSSSCNGYDEEYTMRDLFGSPGAGVGDFSGGVRAGKAKDYGQPLWNLLAEGLRSSCSTRAGGIDPEKFIESLAGSDLQIYWPYSEDWDGTSLPVITFDPGTEDTVNVGYAVEIGADGVRRISEVLVDEKMAMRRPVWVVNRNSDASYKPVVMQSSENSGRRHDERPYTKAMNDFKVLTFRSFTMKRHFDSWFAGGSEFFVKCGAVNGFRASTEAELSLYSASVTDFMVVVKRKYLNVPLDFNAVLVSEWTEQMEDMAFIIIEDDGGTRTSWKCSATVKYNSKSYGFDVEIPIYTKDDIVWRGQLSKNYIERYSGTTGHFGDVDVILSLE